MWSSEREELRKSEREELVESLFERFASLKEKKGGEKLMSVSDFAKALLPSYLHDKVSEMKKEEFESEKVLSKKLKSFLFSMADLDHNGTIDKTEFVYFVTLLSVSPSLFELVFKMFDSDGNGELDQKEWNKVVDTIAHSWGRRRGERGEGGVEGFGITKEKGIKLEEFKRKLTLLKEAVRRLEFRVLQHTSLDKQNKAEMSSKQFLNSLFHFANPKEKEKGKYWERSPTLFLLNLLKKLFF